MSIVIDRSLMRKALGIYFTTVTIQSGSVATIVDGTGTTEKVVVATPVAPDCSTSARIVDDNRVEVRVTCSESSTTTVNVLVVTS